MKYSDFEEIISADRMQRYLQACNGDTRKAMTLYRYNLKVSQEMFTIVSCFEVALRNRINTHLTKLFGMDWLRDSVLDNGIFNMQILQKTRDIIYFAYRKLDRTNSYSHSKLIAEMEFGIWKYMFSPIQYRQSGRNLLSIFPNKPRSSAEHQYNQTFIFNELDKINSLRNRIAHHEPICFIVQKAVIDTNYIRVIYQKILTLFHWMNVDSKSLLYGLDHVLDMADKIDKISSNRKHI
ncbi:MAG: Abi family protein [Muribaculaceae bacterium]|nr:Abi family protein [Muribaculaceae bacterium]